MLFEDVHPDHGFVELWIQRLDDFIVEMLLQMQPEIRSCTRSQHQHAITKKDANGVYLVRQGIKAFEDKFKHGLKVVWAR